MLSMLVDSFFMVWVEKDVTVFYLDVLLMQAEDPQRPTEPTCAALPCFARELSVMGQTGGSGLPPPSPLTFTLQYNYLTHSRESLAS